MRKPVAYIVVLLLLGSTAGCDSNDEGGDSGLTDAEVFIGTWVLANLLLDGSDASALLGLASVENVEVIFATPGRFDLTVVNTDESTMTISGTYQLDESQKTVTLTSSDFTEPIMINYEIQNDDRIVLNSDQPELLSQLSGIDLGQLQVETVTLIVQRES